MKTTTTQPNPGLLWHQLVQEQVRSVRFGVVQIVVHDGQVVQIERTEKFRFDRPTRGPAQAETTLAD
jgi:hypothetical protein